MPLVNDTPGAKFQSLSTEQYSIPKAQIFFRAKGEEHFRLMGDSDEVSLNIEVEETERYTNETGIRQLARTIVTQIDAELSLTLVQLTDLNRALSLMGNLQFATQNEVLAHVQDIEDVLIDGTIYPLDHKNVKAASVEITDGESGAVAYTEGTHYRLDAAAGYVQFLAKPDGAGPDVEITYDAHELTADDKVALIGVASKSENRGTVVIRGTNEVGTRVELVLHDVQLRANAARSYVSETDLAQVELVGRAFRDPSQAAGFEIGYERKIV